MPSDEMPERIWLIPDIGWDGETAWSNDPAPEPGMDPDNATEYLRKDLCALTPASQPEGQVRVLDVDDLAQIIRVVDGNNTLGAGELAEAILEAMPAPRIVGALMPAPQPEGQECSRCGSVGGFGCYECTPSAATPTAQEAVPACFACEDNPKPPNIPCAVCGAHPPQPSETVAEAIAALEALNVIKTGPWCGGYISRKAALRALKGEE